MAGFSKIYFIGGLGGFMGADGINPIEFQILVGDGSRQWLEPHYFDQSIEPIGKIRTIIPEGPDHPHSLLDACISFAPRYFNDCPSLDVIKPLLKNHKSLDFHLNLDNIPSSWFDLRQEALPYFKEMIIFEANLERVNLENYSL